MNGSSLTPSTTSQLALLRRCGQLLALFALAMLSQTALAVAQTIYLDPADAPSLQGSTVRFESNANTDNPVPVQVEQDDRGRVILTFELDPEDAAAGGTLEITPRDGGPKRSVPIGAGALGAGPMQLDPISQNIRPLPIDSIGSLADGPDNRWGIGLSYGQGELEVAPIRTPLGVTAGGLERILLLSEEDIDQDNWSVDLQIPLPDETVFWGNAANVNLTLGYSNTSADDNGAFELASGTEEAFIVFPDFSGAFGTGLFGGSIGGLTQYQLDYDIDRFEVGMAWDCLREMFDRGRLTPFFGVSYADAEQAFESDAAFGLLPDVNAQLQQHSETDLYQLRLGAHYSYPLVGDLRILGGAGIEVQYADTELTSAMTINVPGNSDSLRVKNSTDGTSVGFMLEAGLEYELLDQLKVRLSYGLHSGLDTPTIRNNQSGDDLFVDNLRASPELESASRQGWQLRLDAKF